MQRVYVYDPFMDGGCRRMYSACDALIRISLLLCLSAPAAGRTDEWHRYKNENGNFSVLLPEEPEESVEAEEGDPITYTARVFTPSIGYLVISVVTKEDQAVDEANFENYRDEILKHLPYCHPVKEESASLAVRGFIGHWYRMNCETPDRKFVAAGNLYWGKHYGYAVFVLFSPSTADPPTVKKFTNSFVVLHPEK
jgi:hypothetical protein